ncbi:mechanosensitive ion channel family protein [Paractinoplanes toevensis]|uniref:Uncharacterized protein n=1 Tax=Paractinoplanes toevensis TaxID=571911 RepID=A0A919VZK4_9ACTN|nr:hypothetical protein [Actinoplanes toevensis]GIM90227.1 hypothetical protein Ato02nite_020200 [Actinoplanes toevensis]
MTGNGLGQGLSDMWRSVLLFLPAALAFVVILVVGYIVARLLRTVVAKGLRRAGFDRAVSRGAVGRALRGGGISATDLCAKIVFYAVLLFALQLAFGIWGPNPVSDLLTALIAWLPRAFVAIVIVVVAAAIAGAVHDLIVSALGGLAYGRLVARVVAVVIVALGVIAALDQVRIATSVTQPLLIAVLAMVAGVVIVGVGGGLIRPMQQRWETWLERAGAESSVIREHAKAYAEERRVADEARKAEEERVAEARRAEEVRHAEEARAEETRKTEEKRRAEEAGRAQEAWQAEEKRLAEERRRADEARRAEEARHEAARMAETTQAVTGTVGRDAAETQVVRDDSAVTQVVADTGPGAATTDDIYREAGSAVADETQVIPPPRQGRPRRVTDTTVDLEAVDDRPHVVPGFDRDDDPDSTTVISSDTADTTIVNPGPNAVVIGSDSTQVIPPLDETPGETEPPRKDRK